MRHVYWIVALALACALVLPSGIARAQTASPVSCTTFTPFDRSTTVRVGNEVIWDAANDAGAWTLTIRWGDGPPDSSFTFAPYQRHRFTHVYTTPGAYGLSVSDTGTVGATGMPCRDDDVPLGSINVVP